MANLTNVRVYDVTDSGTPILITNLTVSGNKVTFADVASDTRAYALTNEAGLLSPTSVRLKKSLLTASDTKADYVIVSHPDFIPSLNRFNQTGAKAKGLMWSVEDVTAIF